jgi:hypothetical protein
MTMDLADLMAKLKAQEATLPDPRDAHSENEGAIAWATRRAHARVISTLMNAPDDLAREEATLIQLEARRAAVTDKFAEINAAIDNAPSWSEHPDARERDRRYDRVQHLKHQLQMLHDGTLIRAPGVLYERLSDLDASIQAWTARRDRAQALLDAAVRDAEALLAASLGVAK